MRSDGGVINTHFRAFNKPMGMAVGRGRLAIGTAVDVWEFRNVPAVAAKLDPPGKHDACYLPRSAHVTGDVQIHEMAYVDDEVWFVNTRFSCLATHDPDHSFAPSGGRSSSRSSRPTTAAISTAWASSTAGRGGSPRWAKPTQPAAGARTRRAAAFSSTSSRTKSSPAACRCPTRRAGTTAGCGCLESGTGSLGTSILRTGRYEPIVHLDGFTRGLEMVGNLAFIGLSQVRETAVFSGIQITERLQETERTCGVWVVDIQRGQVVAFLKFEEAVQEIFAVALLPGIRFPDLINDNAELVGSSFVLPDDALRDVPAELRSPG